jgi:hypothetical protein
MQAMAPDEQLMQDALGRMYANIDRTWLETYRGILQHYSASLRPDVTDFDIAHILTATAEGLGLRRLVQFDDKSIFDATRQRSALGKAALALFAASVCQPGDSRTLGTFFREVLTGESSGHRP